MRLLTRNYLQGSHDCLVDQMGMLPFANDKIASDIFDEITVRYGLPVFLDGPLDKTASLAIGRELLAYGEKLASLGHLPSQERVHFSKQAAQRDLNERALVVARHYMSKAADEGSLIPSDQNTLANAAMHDQIARVDAMNRPSGTYGVPVGTTDMSMPGVTGREMAAPGAPMTGASFKGAESDLTLEQLKAQSAAMAEAARKGSSLSNPQAYRGTQMAPSPIHGFHTESPIGAGGRLRTPDQLRTLPDSFKSVESPRTSALETLMHGRSPEVTPGQAGVLRQVGQELGSSPMQHLHHWDQRSGWGKARSAGAMGAQALGAGLALYGAGRGAQALYHHFVPEEEKAAALKQAFDGKEMWDSVKGTARYYRDAMGRGAASGAHQVGNYFSENAKGLGERVTDARNAHTWLGSSPETLLNIGHSNDSMRALRNTNVREALGHGARLAAPAAGLLAAGGLAYGANELYDQYANKNASDASIDAIIKSLQDHGIEVTPEIVAAVHAELEGEGGGEAPPGPPPGTPSPEEVKQAHWQRILKAAAEGSLTPSHENTLANAAQHDQIARVDNKNRPTGTYKTPVGQSALSTAAGEVGAEKKAEQAYWDNLEKTAAVWGQYLPATMDLPSKRAHIERIASIAPHQREGYVRSLYA